MLQAGFRRVQGSDRELPVIKEIHPPVSIKPNDLIINLPLQNFPTTGCYAIEQIFNYAVPKGIETNS